MLCDTNKWKTRGVSTRPRLLQQLRPAGAFLPVIPPPTGMSGPMEPQHLLQLPSETTPISWGSKRSPHAARSAPLPCVLIPVTPGSSADQPRPHPLHGTAGETQAGLALNGCTVQFHCVFRCFFNTQRPKLFNQKEDQLQASLSAFLSSLQGRGTDAITY